MYSGTVRRIDDIGRVTIPKNTRAKHEIKEGDPLEIISCPGGIVIKKLKIEYCEECGKPVHLSDPHFITEKGDIIHEHCAGPYAIDYMSENQLWSLHK